MEFIVLLYKITKKEQGGYLCMKLKNLISCKSVEPLNYIAHLRYSDR